MDAGLLGTEWYECLLLAESGQLISTSYPNATMPEVLDVCFRPKADICCVGLFTGQGQETLAGNHGLPFNATKETTQMHPFRLPTLMAVFLLGLSSAAFASSGASQSREVPLWPEGSRVLQAGIDALKGEQWAITHPSFLLYPPKVNSTRSAILVFPGGGYKPWRSG